VQRWAFGPDKVMDRPEKIMNLQADGQSLSRLQRSRGIPGYTESREPFTVGIDVLATQYAAYAAYSKLLLFAGMPKESQNWSQQAAAVKMLVNDKWWNDQGGYFYSFLGPEHKLSGRAEIDLLYYDVAEDGPKSQATLNNLVARINSTATLLEVESHYPEVLYRYGRPDIAYLEIMNLTRQDRERREYPENSYSVIGAMVTGLMGVRVAQQDTPANGQFVVSTLSGLIPDTAYAEMRHIPVRKNMIGVKHTGDDVTELTNESGPALKWRAIFHGHRKLSVQGKSAKATSGEQELGQPVSWVEVSVPSSSTVTVRANPHDK
jgi:hypothetical protein